MERIAKGVDANTMRLKGQGNIRRQSIVTSKASNKSGSQIRLKD